MLHDLKIHPEYFQAIAEGRKTFEVRFDDRGFREGDEVLLREFEPGFAKPYSGREIRARIGWTTNLGMAAGWCAFALLGVVNDSITTAEEAEP